MTATLQQQLEAARTEPDELARLIAAAVEGGKAREVVAWSEHLARIDPDRVRRYMLHANTLAAAGRVTQAEKVVAKYEQLYGEDADSLTARGEISIRRHLEGAAEELLLKAMTLQPEHSGAARLITALAATNPSRADALLERASSAGSSAVLITLAQRLLAEFRYDDAESLLSRALAAGTPAAREQVSHLLVTAGLYDRVIKLVRVTEWEPAAINVLHALVRRERWSDAATLLSHCKDAPELALYRELAQRALAPPPPSKGDPLLLEALASCARMDTPKTRQKLYRKLLASELLFAFELPRSRDNDPRLRSTPAVLRTTGTLATTTLAFSDETTIRSWRPGAYSMRIPLREIAAFCTEQNLELIINAAGPSSAELSPAELASLARGELPTPSDHDIAGRPSTFLIEQPLTALPDTLLQRLRGDIAEYPELTEAYVVDLVSERFGRSTAVAAAFDARLPSSDRRDVLFDLVDPTRHRARERRVHFFEAAAEQLSLVRKLGVWLIEETA